MPTTHDRGGEEGKVDWGLAAENVEGVRRHIGSRDVRAMRGRVMGGMTREVATRNPMLPDIGGSDNKASPEPEVVLGKIPGQTMVERFSNTFDSHPHGVMVDGRLIHPKYLPFTKENVIAFMCSEVDLVVETVESRARREERENRPLTKEEYRHVAQTVLRDMMSKMRDWHGTGKAMIEDYERITSLGE